MLRTRTNNSLLFPDNVQARRAGNAEEAWDTGFERTPRAGAFFEVPVKIPDSRELAGWDQRVTGASSPAPHQRIGFFSAHTKLPASFVLPEPLYQAFCG